MILKSMAHRFHRLLSHLPPLARCYLHALPLLSSRLDDHRRQQWLNSLSSVDWGNFTFPTRKVTLPGQVPLWLRPHHGEFDFQAVLGGKLSYEHEVFDFLDSVISRYDAVVDIGANVGLFTCWFGRRLAGLGKVYAFEPSRKVFGRLLENVENNQLGNVQIFNCAVGKDSGFATFTEPEGHLTNGSLVESFARQFSQSVKKSSVTVIAADQLTTLLAEHQRVLIKIDTESFETVVLEALAPVLSRWQPDLVIEVLPEFEAQLNGVKILSELGYQAHSITPDGLQRTGRITASHWRDCFLSVEKGS